MDPTQRMSRRQSDKQRPFGIQTEKKQLTEGMLEKLSKHNSPLDEFSG